MPRVNTLGGSTGASRPGAATELRAKGAPNSGRRVMRHTRCREARSLGHAGSATNQAAQSMQVVAIGRASNRPGAIAFPQTTQMP